MAHVLSIIIPVYNEADTVEHILTAVSSAPLPEQWEKEVIIINDGSTDQTANILNLYSKKYTIIHREKNGGKGAALKDGLRLARGQYVLIQDADLEYDPNDYHKLITAITLGDTNVVFGSRVLGRNNVSYSQVYYYGGLWVTKLFNRLFKTRLTDLATCYKVFPQQYCDQLAQLPSDDFTFDVVELTHFLLRHESILEIPISYNSRPAREGKKMNLTHGIRCAKKILELYIRKPSHV